MGDRGTWDIYTLDSGDEWELVDTIYRPNDTFTIKLISTETPISLVNGSEGYVAPEIKSKKSDLTFVWYNVDKEVKDQIEEYIENCESIKIIDQNNEFYFGRFINLDSDWLVGVVGKYDITAVFRQVSSLENI